MGTRRKRKSRYHTGIHVSTKTGRECKYRSGWELSYMQHLDNDPEVTDWSYEALIIPYLSNTKTGKMRRYFPDFTVQYRDGHEEIVEIKPKRKLTQRTVTKKVLAGHDWARAHGVTYRVMTEHELKGLGLL